MITVFILAPGLSSTYSGFKKHLISSHEKDSCQSGDAARPESFQPNFHMLQDTSEVAGTSVMQNPESECFEVNGSGQRNKENTENICASIIFFNYKEVA